MERKRFRLELNTRTPLPEVLQAIVCSYAEELTVLFVADSKNRVVRAVTLQDYSVRTYTGKLKTRNHHDASRCEATFVLPMCLDVHRASRSLLVGDFHASCLRRVNRDQTRTLCGNPTSKGYCEGTSQNAKFNHISGVAVVGNHVFVSDFRNHVIRRVPLNGGSSSLWAGQPGTEGFEDSPNAKFSFPHGLSADSQGNVYVADKFNHAIRVISSAGVVRTLAGGTRGFQNGSSRDAHFNGPSDCAWDGQDGLIIADTDNCCLRRVNIQTGTVTTFAGQPCKVGHEDGVVSLAKLRFPLCVVVVTTPTATGLSLGTVFVSCLNDTIRCVFEGTVTTVQLGHAPEKRLSHPLGLALM